MLARTTLDVNDAAVLEWIIAICKSVNPKVEKQRLENWTWIDYGKLINDMPLLRVKSKGSITPRIQRIVENGFIEVKQIDGRKLYAKLKAKVESLVFKDDTEALFKNLNSAVQKTEQSTEGGTVQKTEPIRILYKDIKDNIGEANAPLDIIDSQIPLVIKEFETVNPWCKTIYGNKAQRTAIRHLIEDYSFEQVIKVVKILPQTNKITYIPETTTPVQLHMNWKRIENGLTKLKAKKTENTRLVF